MVVHDDDLHLDDLSAHERVDDGPVRVVGGIFHGIVTASLRKVAHESSQKRKRPVYPRFVVQKLGKSCHRQYRARACAIGEHGFGLEGINDSRAANQRLLLL